MRANGRASGPVPIFGFWVIFWSLDHIGVLATESETYLAQVDFYGEFILGGPDFGLSLRVMSHVSHDLFYVEQSGEGSAPGASAENVEGN